MPSSNPNGVIHWKRLDLKSDRSGGYILIKIFHSVSFVPCVPGQSEGEFMDYYLVSAEVKFTEFQFSTTGKYFLSLGDDLNDALIESVQLYIGVREQIDAYLSVYADTFSPELGEAQLRTQIGWFTQALKVYLSDRTDIT